MSGTLFIRQWAVVCALFGATLTAHAQTQAPVAPVAPAPAAAPTVLSPLQKPSEISTSYTDYLNQRYANDKEARAAIHMFGRKKTGGALWLIGGGGLLAYLVSQTGTTVSSTGTRTLTISPLGYLVFGGLPAAIAIGKFSRFNNDKLYKVLLDYDSSHTLPGYVVAKLGSSDYH